MLVFITLLAVLGFLWFLDEITTKIDIQKFGPKAEKNPIMRFLIKKGFKYVTEFKIISFIIFVAISYLLYSIHAVLFYGFALLLITLYLGVNVRNILLSKIR